MLTSANQHGIALGVAVALTAIHGAGVIHRDLKPSNVLLAPGSPKVIDFGIARAASGGNVDTRTDQLVGTVSYMAPERFGPDARQALTPAADVFAWGAIVAFAASGRTPFAADLPAAVAARIMTHPPDLEGLSGPLRGLVERALAKDPSDRPTARELVDSLLAGGDRLTARPAAFVEQPEVLAAAGIAATGVGVIAPVVGGPDPAPAVPGPADAATRIVAPVPGRPPVVPASHPRGSAPRPSARVPPAGPTVYLPRPRRGSGIRVAVVALTVAVLLLAGAVAAIWTGKLGLSAAADPSPSATVLSQTVPQATSPQPTSPPSSLPVTPSPEPSVAPTPTRAPQVSSSVAPGAVSLVAGSFGNWTSNDDPDHQARCEVGNNELTVSLSSATTRSYRCKGPRTS